MDRGSSTLRTMLIVLGSSWFTLIISVVQVLILPSKLGDGGMGQVTLALSLTGFFLIFTVLGTSNYLVRAVAREHGLLSRYVSNIVLLRTVLSAGIMAACMGSAYLLNYSVVAQQVIFIMSIRMVILTLSNALESGLQAVGEMGMVSIARTVGNVSTSIIGVALLLYGADVMAYAVSYPLGALAQLVVAGSYLFFKYRVTFSLDIPIVRAMLIGGLPLFIWSFLQTTYGSIDAMLLGVFATEHVVGWFGAAAQITSVLFAVPVAISSVAMPMLCRLNGQGDKSLENAAARTMTSTLLVLAPIGAGLALSSAEAIQMLNYPTTFMHSVPVLALLALSLPVTGALMMLGSLAVAAELERQWVKISAVGFCTFPPLYSILIVWFQANMGNGAIGAALANLVGESILLVWAWFILPERLRGKSMLAQTGRVVALTIAMSGAVLLLKACGAPLVIYAPLGAGIYLAGACALRLVTGQDLHLVRSAIMKRARHAGASA